MGLKLEDVVMNLTQINTELIKEQGKRRSLEIELSTLHEQNKKLEEERDKFKNLSLNQSRKMEKYQKLIDLLKDLLED